LFKKIIPKYLLKIAVVALFSFYYLGSLAVAQAHSQDHPEDDRQTDQLISILEKTHYLDFIDSRIHGWPQNDTSKAYWWGTYWSGVRIFKKNGVVTYQHGHDGSDNNGFRTAALMEGVCYAQALAPNPKWDLLIRKMIRGFSSWILSSEQASHPEYPRVLSRAHYTNSVLSLENNRTIYINYDLNLPGADNASTQYVEIKDNPTFGSIWVKNSRSRDDLGEMIRAIAQLKSCENELSAETKIDLQEMRNLYSDWSADVDSNQFETPSLTKKGEYNRDVSGPTDRFVHGLLPAGNLAMRLLHQKDPGKYSTISLKDSLSEKLLSKWLRNDALEMLRAMEVAAVVMSKVRQNDELTGRLMKRLQLRVNRDMDYVFHRKPALHLNPDDVSAVLINSYNVGLALNDEQQKFLFDSIEKADERISADDPTFRIFSSKTPDGEYSYDAPDPGMQFRSIGLILGTCSSTFKTTNNKPLFNCQKIQKYLANLNEPIK
jgi:hypothetical protein